MQPIGLRSLVNYYLKKDIHSGVHNAESDAVATLQMFDVYKKIKIKDGQTRENFHSQNEFEGIKTMH